MNSTWKYIRPLVWSALLLAPSAAGAGVTLDFDVKTLSEVLPAMTLDEIVVPIAQGRSLTVGISDLKVTGFDPAGGKNGEGSILTSLRLHVPQLGLDLPLQPRLSLQVVDVDARSTLELRFEQVQLQLPFAGALDLAGFLPPLRFPAENIWGLDGLKGEAQVRSRLTGVKMGRQELRFEFDVDLVRAPPGP